MKSNICILCENCEKKYIGGKEHLYVLNCKSNNNIFCGLVFGGNFEIQKSPGWCPNYKLKGTKNEYNKSIEV